MVACACAYASSSVCCAVDVEMKASAGPQESWQRAGGLAGRESSCRDAARSDGSRSDQFGLSKYEVRNTTAGCCFFFRLWKGKSSRRVPVFDIATFFSMLLL